MQVKVTPVGVLNKDTDNKYIGKGNYTDAVNIRHRDFETENSDGEVSLIPGNDLRVTIPDVVAQDKQYRIYIETSGVYTGSENAESEVTIKDNGGASKGTVSVNINQRLSVIATDVLSGINALTTGTFTNITPDDIVVTEEKLSNDTGGIRNVGSVDTTNDNVTIGTNFSSNPTIANGDAVFYESTGLPIGGLSDNTTYYVRVLSGIVFELYPTRSDALNSTNRIDLTSFPTATHKLTRVNNIKGYFDIEESGALDESYQIITKKIENLKQPFEAVMIQDHIYQNEALNIIGSVTIDDDLFVVSVTDTTFYGGLSILNPELRVTIAELGYVKYDETTTTHEYIRLLRTKDFEFNKDYRVEMVGEKRSNAAAIYMTDGNTTPKVVYVDSPYFEDCALQVNGGEYNLTNLTQQLELFTTTSKAHLEFESITDGGRLKAGNKRYTGYFLGNGNTPTEYLYPTNPIPVYPTDFTNAVEIQGGDIGEICDKAIRLRLTDIPAGAYEYFVLVAIEYEGESFSVSEIKKYAIGKTETVLNVEHNGFGDLNQPVLLEDVVRLYSKYIKVQNMSIFSNRLLLSNLTEKADDVDLSDWASSITHSLEEQLLDSVGLMGETFNATQPDMGFGEYQDPLNVFNFTGYMMNDTYRFGIQVKWKNGGKWSAPYWVDDIRFDTESYNIINDPGFNRRTANNLDVSLTRGETNAITDTDFTVYTKSYYVKFGNIDLSYLLPDGKTLKDSIDGIKFVRAERIPEVLATGMFNNGFLASGVAYPFGWGSLGYAGLAAWRNTTTTPLDDGDKVGFFISPDIYYNSTEYQYQTGDKVKFLGSFYGDTASDIGVDYVNETISAKGNIQYGDTTGFYNPGLTYQDYDIDEVESLTSIKKYEITPGLQVTKKLATDGSFRDFTHAFLFTNHLRANVGHLQSDNGMYYGQIFRDKGAHLKYPTDKSQTLYYGTGHYLSVDDLTDDIVEEGVFGGDVFTQKTHMKFRIPDAPEQDSMGMGFYSQNVVNTQLPTIEEHNLSDVGPGYKFPQYLDKEHTFSFVSTTTFNNGSWGSGLVFWVRTWDPVYNQRNYNFGYNFDNDKVANVGFDPLDDFDGKKPTTIIWSEPKLVGGNIDNFRVFMPINFTDLDMTNGNISHHDVINNSFYTWQDRSFMRHYFNEGTLVSPASGSDVVLGTSEFAGPPAAEISSIGCDKKWSIVKGKTTNGNQAVYWFNHRLKKFLRFGQDGVRVLSDNSLSSYLNNEIKYLRDEMNPCTNYGIHGVWNDIYSEAIFTFKGIDQSIPQYSGGTLVTGDLVINDNAARHHSGVHTIFRATTDFTVSADEQEPGVGADWEDYWEELTPETNPEYYTLISIVYDELKNGFITEVTFWPNIYVPIENTYYSVNGSQRNKLYLHDVGSYSTFYDVAYDGSITSVMNYEPNVSKNFEALQVNSLIKPYRVDFYTKNHISFTPESEFEGREDLFYGYVRNDSTGTGIANNDTSRLWGTYLKSKITFQKGVKQKLFNYIVKFRPMARLYNT